MEISDALVQIADKLETTTKHLAEVFINAQTTIGYINIISALLWVLIVSIICYTTHRWYIKNGDDRCSDGCAVVFCLLGIILTLFFLLILKDEAIRVMCPEYMGIKDLIETLSYIVGK